MQRIAAHPVERHQAPRRGDRGADHPASSPVSRVHRRRPAGAGVVEANRRRSTGDGPGNRHHAGPTPWTSPDRGDADEHADHRSDRSPVLPQASSRLGRHPVRRSGGDAARTHELRVRRRNHLSGAALVVRSARYPAALRRAVPSAGPGQRLVSRPHHGELVGGRDSAAVFALSSDPRTARLPTRRSRVPAARRDRGSSPTR